MRIKEHREAAGMTRLELAEELGVTSVAVRKWEVGLTTPNADKLPALADVLGCSIDALFGREPVEKARRPGA